MVPAQPDPGTFLAGVRAVEEALASGGGMRTALGALAEEIARALPVRAVGVVLADRRGTALERAVYGGDPGSAQLARSIWDSGAGQESFRSGRPVDAVLPEGAVPVTALPVETGERVVGVVGLVRLGPRALDEEEREWAATLASAVVIGLELKRAAAQAEARVAQLQRALDGRIVIEQAKGYLAARRGLDVGQASELMRGHARARGLRMEELARALLDGSADWRLLG